MKKLFLVLGLVVILTIVAFAIPQAGRKRMRILNRISDKTYIAEELIYTYFQGYVEVNGIRFNLTQEQKDSLKAKYNEVIHYLQDSIPYDSLFAPE